MKKFVCVVCGYIHEGETAPEVCPVCKVGADKFEEMKGEMKGEMKWADEHRIGVAAGVDEEILEAATLAAYYSKAKMSANVPVDYTIKKHVKKPSGAKPGMVIYETNKTAYVTPSDEAKAKIRGYE